MNRQETPTFNRILGRVELQLRLVDSTKSEPSLWLELQAEHRRWRSSVPVCRGSGFVGAECVLDHESCDAIQCREADRSAPWLLAALLADPIAAVDQPNFERTADSSSHIWQLPRFKPSHLLQPPFVVPEPNKDRRHTEQIALRPMLE